MSGYPKDKRPSRPSKHLDFIVADFLILEVSYLLACAVHHLWRYGSFTIRMDTEFRHQVLLLFLSLVVSLTVGKTYHNILKRGRLQEVQSTFRHAFNMMLVDVICLFFIHEAGSMSRVAFALTWVFYFAFELTFRMLWKRHLHKIYMTRGGRTSMILLSSSTRVREIIRDLQENPFREFFISAVFLTDYDAFYGRMAAAEKEPLMIDALPVLGDQEDMIRYASHNWVDRAFLDVHQDRKLEKRLIRQFDQMGITTNTLVAKIHLSREGAAQYVEQMGHFAVLTQTARYVPFMQVFAKRALDIAGGLVGCAVTGILFLFVAPAIYLKSPGPVFFMQMRVGRNGKPFKMYKFRSMYLDAEKRKQELLGRNKVRDGMMFKLDDDPRIIGSEKKDKYGRPRGIGNFIRRTSIDEFPQFYNVLKGDMSLVGTRPPTLDEWAHYSPRHRARMSIRPGITGMWQISGRSDIVDFDQIVELDMQYIQNWTIWMDIRIIAKTLLVVWKREGAE